MHHLSSTHKEALIALNQGMGLGAGSLHNGYMGS